MCLIAVIPPKQEPNLEALEFAFENNPDGAGLAWVKGGRVEILKGLYKDFDKWRTRIKRAMDKKDKGSPLLAHCRQATHGVVSVSNCHPFIVHTMAVMHNGILRYPTLDKDESDTAAFVRSLNALPENFMKIVELWNLVQAASLGSKLAFLLPNSEVVTTGIGWTEDKGIKYSNSGYKKQGFGFLLSKYHLPRRIQQNPVCRWCKLPIEDDQFSEDSLCSDCCHLLLK